MVVVTTMMVMVMMSSSGNIDNLFFQPLSPLGKLCTGVNNCVINCTLEDVSVMTTYLTDDVKEGQRCTHTKFEGELCVSRDMKEDFRGPLAVGPLT